MSALVNGIINTVKDKARRGDPRSPERLGGPRGNCPVWIWVCSPIGPESMDSFGSPFFVRLACVSVLGLSEFISKDPEIKPRYSVFS